MTLRRLARISSTDSDRVAHVHAARDAWKSIGREDLVQKLTDEFGDDAK